MCIVRLSLNMCYVCINYVLLNLTLTFISGDCFVLNEALTQIVVGIKMFN